MTTEHVLASAVLETAYRLDKECGMNSYNFCRHCDARVYWDIAVSHIVHGPNCVVLVALDVIKKYEDDQASSKEQLNGTESEDHDVGC